MRSVHRGDHPIQDNGERHRFQPYSNAAPHLKERLVRVGDIVTVSTPRLGTLANRVNTSDRIAPWTYGTAALMRDLARRGLLR